MALRLAVLMLIAAISAGLAQGLVQGLAQGAGGGPAPEGSAPAAWPPLPTTGFVTGRAATDRDVAEGNAVFALRAYGIPFGKPLDVVIPQYAYLVRKGQEPLRVIVVQAEEGKGVKIFGFRDLNGNAATARESDLQLLGTHPPQ